MVVPGCLHGVWTVCIKSENVFDASCLTYSVFLLAGNLIWIYATPTLPNTESITYSTEAFSTGGYRWALCCDLCPLLYLFK